MRRLPELVRTLATHLTCAAVVGLAGVAAIRWLGASAAVGQQADAITEELDTVLARTRPYERIPVLVEFRGAEPSAPYAIERPIRAAEHASDLADLYGRRLAELRRVAPVELATELSGGELVWVGGALAVELTAARISNLAVQPGVRTVYYDGLVRVELSADRAAPTIGTRPALYGTFPGHQGADAGLPWGLQAIGARELWDAGMTGSGAVVAIIDSGVDGEHPLLSGKWRGLGTSPAEAWFDPWGRTERPVDDDRTGSVGHGTIVATVAVGGLEPGDTLVEVGGSVRVAEGPLDVVTGVAPGAEWIAANAFEEFGDGTYTRRSILLQALQWALDPDGDPATPTDVPDVVNNSWGFLPGRCDGVFDRAIDALERVGVPVVFAAGNRTAGFDTVAAPANRADLLLNAFAVGSVRDRDGEFVPAENSLGGPSPCAPGAVKPEVGAPGVIPLVRNRGPRAAQVIAQTGPFTSWAAPHAAGALALLRGLNATASSNALKEALFSTARDLPPPGLDNQSGAGLIDVAAAAARVGGLGAVRLEIAGWDWDSTAGLLALDLQNRGDGSFSGGAAQLRGRSEGDVLSRTEVPPILPRGRAEVAFGGLRLHLAPPLRLGLRVQSEYGVLDFPLTLRVDPVGEVQLVDQTVTLTLDAGGRLGRVAGSPGFDFAGVDWLTAGAFLYADADGVSDAAYVDVQGQRSLKANPVGTDTDWSGSVTERGPSRARLIFDDSRALQPTGTAVESSVDLVVLDDSAAFVLIQMSVRQRPVGSAGVAGLLLDWDFAVRDTVFWDRGLEASVMRGSEPGEPWVALATAPASPTTHAAIPLGAVEGGQYTLGTGILARPVTDDQKARLLRLGQMAEPGARATDWAQMVGVGPVTGNESLFFVIGIASSRARLRAALDEARSRVGPILATDSNGRSGDGLALLPAFPNPFDPARGQMVNLPFLAQRASEPTPASLEIFTIAGRRVHRERRRLAPDVPVEPFRWDGRLDNGELAATGVYGYVIRVGDQRRTGRFVLLK